MKKISFLILCVSCIICSSTAQQLKIEPAFWWTGMKNSELQIQVYGKDIASFQASVNVPGLKIKDQVRLESPNYLFLYFDLKDAKPGKFTIVLTKDKKKITVPYELKNRDIAPEKRIGFNSEDVLYLIMPDRFANGDTSNDKIKMKNDYIIDRNDPNARHGGDLLGIEKHLDYIQDLGVTAIWLNPVLENDMPGGSYHGYATTDYYKIDPRFGTNEDYIRLINKTHEKGMKVVMDMIFNHCGSEHLWMHDRPSHDWFNNPDKYVQTSYRLTGYFDPYASDFDKSKAVDGWFVQAMPDLNQRNYHVARYLTQNSIWWVEYAGIDGIRMDTHPYADFDMMSGWCKEILNEYPNFNIVGEAWYNTVAGTAWWQKDSKLNLQGNTYLKTVMDFPMAWEINAAVSEETQGESGLHRIYNQLGLDYLYTDTKNVLVFLDNHDTDRFRRADEKNLDRFKQGLTFLLTTRGIPQIYYGTEVLMNGSKAKSDGYIRLDFPGGWPGDTKNEFISSGRNDEQNEAFNYLKKLLHWRKNNEVISKGDLKHFLPSDGIYTYARSYNGKTVLVMINGTSRNITGSTERYKEILSKTSGTDILSGKKVDLEKEVSLKPREILIIEI